MKRLFPVLALAAAPALANDSIAETSAGGLVLVRSASIDMVSEDLFVSADEVRVRYKFRNDRSRAGVVQAVVAFPMPDRDLSEERDWDVAFPSDFDVQVDGRPAEVKVETNAMLGAADHTATLTALGIPPGGEEDLVDRALNELSAADRAKLVRLGLAEPDEFSTPPGRLLPMWTVKQTFYWEQAFRAGRDTIVDHRYRPGTGESVGTALVDPEFRASAEGRQIIADYCVDAAFLAGLERMKRGFDQDWPPIGEKRIGYILTTGANWASPIADFRLVVDKGRPENLVSFCGTGVRKISPTQFEMRRANWRPDRDLKVLIVFPHPQAE